MILITLLGQTSSGKSEMAVELAKQLMKAKKRGGADDKTLSHFVPAPLSGSNLTLDTHLYNSSTEGKFINAKTSVWIVNCDSRQVYKELNIGTGKVEGNWTESTNFPLSRGGQGVFKNKVFYYKSIPHFLIDNIAIEQKYNVSDFVQDFIKILDTPKRPDYIILTGGTGLYAKAIYDEMELGLIQPEFEELFEQHRLQLRKFSLLELQKLYAEASLALPRSQVKPETTSCSTSNLNNSDFNNPRRLQSFLLRNTAKTNNWLSQINYPKFDKKFLFAISRQQAELKELIEKRLQSRITQGLLEEVQTLITKYGHQRIEDFGLEYRLTSLYLKGQLTETAWKSSMLKENIAYAKRQLTWLKKESIIWVQDLNHLTDQLKILQ